MAKIPPVEHYDGTNYEDWGTAIRMHLLASDLWDYVEGDKEVAPSKPIASASANDKKIYNEWMRENAKAYEVISLTLVPPKRPLLRGLTTAKAAWARIKEEGGTVHSASSAGRLMELMFQAKLQDFPDISSYMAEIENRKGKLEQFGTSWAFTDQQIIVIMLMGLPDVYSTCKELLYDKEESKRTLAYVRQRLLERESALQADSGAIEKAFNVRGSQSKRGTGATAATKKKTPPATYTRGGPCVHCKFDHPSAKCYSKRTADFRAQNPGKLVPNWQLADREDAAKSKQKGQASKVSQNDSSDEEDCDAANEMFPSVKANTFSAYTASQGRAPICLDSGCSTTMSNNRDDFVDFEKFTQPRLLNGAFEGLQCHAYGRGTIRLHSTARTSGHHTMELRKCLYVPQLHTFLLSISQLDKQGYQVLFSGSRCTIFKEDAAVAAGSLRGKLYYLNPPDSENSQSTDTAQAMGFWHERLGHPSQDKLQVACKNALITGLPSAPCASKQPCSSCLAGKQKRKIFRPSTRRSTAPLELVHMDLMGPVKPATKGGNEYALVMVDDFSRMSWVRLLKRKSDAFSTFGTWARLVETEKQPLTIRSIRTDNGGEFINSAMRNWCEQRGIRHETTVAYTPQQNGVAERRNGLLMSTVRSLLQWSNVHHWWWGEAILYASHLTNHWPSSACGQDLPIHLWTGRKPSVSTLHSFGCVAHVHVPKKHLTSKLEPRSRPCLFLGVQDTTKGFRCYDPKLQKVVISRDIDFEDGVPFAMYSGEPPRSAPRPSLLDNGTDAHNDFEDNDEARPPTPRASDIPVQDEVIQEPDNSDVPVPFSDDEPSFDAGADMDSTSDSDSVDVGPQGVRPLASLYKGPERGEAGGAHPGRRISKRPVSRPLRYRDSEETSRLCHLAKVTDNADVAFALHDTADPELPQNVHEAWHQNAKWHAATDNEWDSLIKNGTFHLVPRSKGMHVLKNKWVFRVKSGDVHKARVTVKGCGQKQGVDYNEVFAPTAKLTSLRLILHLAAELNLEVESIDFVTAFLNGDLDEDIFMEQVPGYEDSNYPDHVLKLDKSLYGLKQAPRQWFAKLRDALLELGFSECKSDLSIFSKHTGDTIFFIVVFVDDLALVSNNTEQVCHVKAELARRFEMKDLGPLTEYLGMEVSRDRTARTITLRQEKYISKLLQKFRMEDCHGKTTPLPANHNLLEPDLKSPVLNDVPYAQLVGSLMYLMVCTRPDLAYTLSVLTRFMAEDKHTEAHWDAAKRTLRYLQHSKTWGLTFKGQNKPMEAYCDASWADIRSNRHSTLGYCVGFGSSPVSWRSKKSDTVALSSTEAEYYAGVEVAKEVKWLKELLQELQQPLTPTTVWCDNQSAIAMTNHPVFHARSKHIEVKYHYIRELCEAGVIVPTYISTTDNLADLLTKALPEPRHLLLTTSLLQRPTSDSEPAQQGGVSEVPEQAAQASTLAQSLGPGRTVSLRGASTLALVQAKPNSLGPARRVRFVDSLSLGKSSSAVARDSALLDHVTCDVASMAAVHAERVGDTTAEDVHASTKRTPRVLAATRATSQEALAYECERSLAAGSFLIPNFQNPLPPTRASSTTPAARLHNQESTTQSRESRVLRRTASISTTNSPVPNSLVNIN